MVDVPVFPLLKFLRVKTWRHWELAVKPGIAIAVISMAR